MFRITDTSPNRVVLDELGRRLSQYREHYELTQQELAAASGIGIATLRRMEAGSDAQLGSWVKVLLALDRADALNGLLPEQILSPMAQVKAISAVEAKRPTRPKWGDEK